MEAALRITTKVLPGKKIEVSSPELVEGEAVEILIVLPGPAKRQKRSVMDIIEGGGFPSRGTTAEEVDRYIEQERDSWDR